MEVGEQENIKLTNFQIVPVDSSPPGTYHTYLQEFVKSKSQMKSIFQWDF